ncbi:MAG TPA: glycoside hydrolase family 88 protein, partial [Lentzea sp.]
DGVFMLNPFLVEFGEEFGDSSYANEEAAKQINVYASHLQQPNGILKHAWDESKSQPWADKTTGLAPEYWCRAMGWWGMASIDVLEKLPLNHPRRAQMITDLREYAAGVRSFQDTSGRWFQVVDKGSRSDNWTETSCSMMFTYVFSKGVERGYLDPSFRDAASKGYAGVLAKTSVNSSGRTEIRDISIGTNVGDYAYYIARDRATNDFHGLGAFLIMNEQLRKG